MHLCVEPIFISFVETSKNVLNKLGFAHLDNGWQTATSNMMTSLLHGDPTMSIAWFSRNQNMFYFKLCIVHYCRCVQYELENTWKSEMDADVSDQIHVIAEVSNIVILCWNMKREIESIPLLRHSWNITIGGTQAAFCHTCL